MVQWGTENLKDVLPVIDAGSFWTPISGEKFRTVYRLPAELSTALIVEQLKLAIITVTGSLAAWRKNQTAATLEDIPQDEVAGTGTLVTLWERAVFCQAKAELLRETVTVDRRSEAENAAKSGEETEEKYREFSADAISALAGVGLVACESI